MIRKLAAAVAMSPEIDAAFMISIRESSLRLPEPNHPLFSLPKLQRTAFTPDTLPHDIRLTPIVVEGVTWINIKSVNIFVFLRGADGKFNFSMENALSAQGVSMLFWYFGIYVLIFFSAVVIPSNGNATRNRYAQPSF
jgi:hypothetical protein